MNGFEILFGRRKLSYVGKRGFQKACIPGWGDVYLLGEIFNMDLKQITPETDFSNLFGRFVLVFSANCGSFVQVVTDRYGLYPFFYHDRTDSILIGEDAAGLKSSIRPDWKQKLAELMAFNQPLDKDTYWQGVSRFEAASVIEFSDDSKNTKSRRHWDKEKLISDQNLCLNDYKDSLLDLFLESCDVSSRDNSSPALTLSGGIDSRLILAGLLHNGRSPQTWTTGVLPNRAIKYSYDMAMLSGVDHHIIPLGREFISQYPNITLANISRNSGLSLSSEAEASWLRDSMPKDFRLLHGAFGELYKINHMHDFAVSDITEQTALDKGIERFSNELTPRFELRRDVFFSITGIHLELDIKASIRERVSSVPTLRSSLQLGQWLYIEEYLQKVTGMSMLMWSERCSPVCPLSYPKFVDLLLRIRPADRREPLWPLYALKKISPDLANYPNSNTNAKIGASKQEIFIRKSLAWTYKKVRRLKSVGEHTDTVGWIEGFDPSLEEAMHLSLLSNQIDLNTVNTFVKSCIEKRDSRLAEALITAFTVSNSPLFHSPS
jgi:hypothetical protein